MFADSYFVTWGARADQGSVNVLPGVPLPSHGMGLGKLAAADLDAVISKGLVQFSK